MSYFIKGNYLILDRAEIETKVTELKRVAINIDAIYNIKLEPTNDRQWKVSIYSKGYRLLYEYYGGLYYTEANTLFNGILELLSNINKKEQKTGTQQDKVEDLIL